jgi:hypothetical protein
VDTLQDKLADEQADLAELQQEMEAAIADAEAAWTEKARAVEPVELTLARTDVTVDELVLVWVPTGD